MIGGIAQPWVVGERGGNNPRLAKSLNRTIMGTEGH
jgi:hypothetical protein